MPNVLLDTGPLVALFKRNDLHHERAISWFKGQRGTLLTTQAVVTEAWHLVSEHVRLPLVRFVTAACVVCEFRPEDMARLVVVLERYADLPMDYADATLIVMAESQKLDSVATIDINDFSTYRLANGKALKLVF